MTTTNLSRPLSHYFCQRFLLPVVCQNHIFVVSEILKRSDIEINIRSNRGQTALSLAAGRGHADIITLLLQSHSVDVNAQDIDGQTALCWAVFNEHNEIVSRLLQNPDVRIDIADIDGMTPLSWAIAKGCAIILVLLFERLGVYPTKSSLQILLRASVAVVPVATFVPFNALKGRWLLSSLRFAVEGETRPLQNGWGDCLYLAGRPARYSHAFNTKASSLRVIYCLRMLAKRMM